jgi:hypothetical protein
MTDGFLRDATGGRWRIADDALIGESGEELPRIPAHRAFWFGWLSQHPDTELHK